MAEEVTETTQEVPPVDAVKLAAERAERLKLEREKLAAELEQERKARSELEARIREVEEARKKEELARMKPDERMQAQLAALQAQVQGAEQALAAERASMEQKIRSMELVAYRERALRSLPQDLPNELLSFISGNSSEEIDRNTAQVLGAYRTIRDQAVRSIPAQAERPAAAVAAPPPNPAYVPAVAGGAYPAVVNPATVQESSPSVIDTRSLTSEDMIRSGKYAQVRDQLHAMLRQNGQPGMVGSTPRQWTSAPQTPVQYAQQAGGVMAPQGLAAPQAPPAQDARAAALEAIARARAGKHPGNQVPGSFSSPQEAFAARFEPTPPAR